jgi:ATP-dependent RNA helicase MSS116
MGFRDDIEAIMEFLPKTPERQTLLFSATVSRSVQQVARAALDKRHEFIDCVPKDESPVHAHVAQYHTVVPRADQQIPHLLRLLAHDQLTKAGNSKVIVFLPTTKMVQLFATLLRELAGTTLPAGRRTAVYEIHSKRTMEARTATSDRFRGDKSGASILVTSDVSARGVDYPGVSRVIQVGIPQSADQYVHRVGRTGRGGATGGRGDFVLLPWEVGFVTWQLTDVPLKPLTTESLRQQVTDLAGKLDADPAGFYADVKAPTDLPRDKYGRETAGPMAYKTPYLPVLNNQERAVSELLTQVDEEAVKETMASMLGYYISKTPELRVQKNVIVEGLKAWTVEACGLPTPPYISQSFLERLGFSDNRTKRFGKAWSPQDLARPSRDDNSNRWMGRGRQASKGREEGRPSWAAADESNYREAGDPRGDPKEYRTPRFNKSW